MKGYSPKERKLVVRKSQIPGAGKGLFTRLPIAKGEVVIEYEGKRTTWRKIVDNEVFNGYVFYISRNHVVDAKDTTDALGRYANDAKGIGKIKGLRNNSTYITRQKRVFIKATKNIPAGAEILVDYGKEYWDVIRENIRAEKKHKKTLEMRKKIR